MEAGEDRPFCARCGRYVDREAQSCPGCGAWMPGASYEERAAEVERARALLRRRLRQVAWLLTAYSVIFLALGLLMLAQVGALAEYVATSGSFDSLLEDYGMGQDDVEYMLKYLSFSMAASGAFGLGAAALCWRRERYWAAYSLCGLSLIAGTVSFVGMLVVIMAFWVLAGCKPAFKEFESALADEASDYLE